MNFDQAMPTHTFMELALDEAHAAADAGEVPIGCVIVCDGDLIAQAANRTLTWILRGAGFAAMFIGALMGALLVIEVDLVLPLALAAALMAASAIAAHKLSSGKPDWA